MAGAGTEEESSECHRLACGLSNPSWSGPPNHWRQICPRRAVAEALAAQAQLPAVDRLFDQQPGQRREGIDGPGQVLHHSPQLLVVRAGLLAALQRLSAALADLFRHFRHIKPKKKPHALWGGIPAFTRAGPAVDSKLARPMSQKHDVRPPHEELLYMLSRHSEMLWKAAGPSSFLT